jgi:hypothetical protein
MDAVIQVHEAVEQREHPDAREREPAPVKGRCVLVGPRAAGGRDRQQPLRQHGGDRAEGQHDEEDRAPAEMLHQQAPDARPECRRQHHAEPEDSHRASLRARLEGAQDDDRRHDLQHTGRQTLQRAHRQHDVKARRQAAHQPAEH